MLSTSKRAFGTTKRRIVPSSERNRFKEGQILILKPLPTLQGKSLPTVYYKVLKVDIENKSYELKELGKDEIKIISFQTTHETCEWYDTERAFENFYDEAVHK